MSTIETTAGAPTPAEEPGLKPGVLLAIGIALWAVNKLVLRVRGES